MPTTMRRTDLEIHEEAVAELDWDDRFAPGEVGVEIDDGVITLRGTVSSYPKLRAAADLVSRIAPSASVCSADCFSWSAKSQVSGT